MLRKIGNVIGGVLLGCSILLIILLRIAFGVAIYAIAFGAAYIILWELGVL